MSRNSLKTVPHVRKTDLFGVDPAWPNGLRYVPEFVSVEEERVLIQAFQALPIGARIEDEVVSPDLVPASWRHRSRA